MKFCLNGVRQYTVLAPEILEIYQPVVGYEAMAVWINLFHALTNGHVLSEQDFLQQMNITQKVFRNSIAELKKYKLLEAQGKDMLVVTQPLTASELLEFIKAGAFSSEQERRFTTLVESFLLKRGLTAYCEDDSAAAAEAIPAHNLTDQQADEFATRFIKECNFVPSRQLRERFDLWFEQIRDCRLLEELLERTRRKVQLEGSKGSCPSLYADKIVRQWLVQGIRTYADLARYDQEFQARWEYYRVVEKELGRSYNSLTPAEKEIIDQWISEVSDVNELSAILKRAILSGEYQGKGAPTISFIAQWLGRQGAKERSGKDNKAAGFTHQHRITDLQSVIKRKTMVGLEGDE